MSQEDEIGEPFACCRRYDNTNIVITSDPPGAFAPRKANCSGNISPGNGFHRNFTALPDFGSHVQRGQKCNPHPHAGHLPQGIEAGSLIILKKRSAKIATKITHLIMQMKIRAERKHIKALQVVDMNGFIFCQRVIARHCEIKGLPEQAQADEFGLGERHLGKD